MVRFLCLFGLMAFAALVIDNLNHGGPFGGFFMLIAWWGIVAATRLFMKTANSRPSAKTILVTLLALLILDLLMADRVYVATVQLHRTAADPFQGTIAERQTHVLEVWYVMGLLALYGIGLFFWLIALFPSEARNFGNQIRDNLITRIKENRKECAAYLVASLVAILLELSGQGPLRAMLISMISFFAMLLLLERKAVFRSRTVANWSFALFLIAIVIPHHAEALQRMTILQEVLEESSPTKKAVLLHELQLDNLSEEAVQEKLMKEGAKLGLLGLFVVSSVVLFKLYWLNRGLKPLAGEGE